MSLTSDQTLFRPDSRLTPDLVAAYRADGSWRDLTLASYLREAVKAHPERVAAVSYDTSGKRISSLSYADLGDLVDRLAAGLAALGVGTGNTVSVMLPNRVEFGALIFAIASLGAVYSGIPATYGRREVSFMLRRAESKVLVVVESFRSRDLVALARELKQEAPALEHVVVLGAAPREPGWRSFEELAATPPLARPPVVNPASLAHIGFTSGTTSEPKGVMNTHQTLDSVLRRWIEHVGIELFAPPVANLIASPVGHHTGFLWGVLLSAYVQGKAVFLEHWSASAAAALIRDEGVTMLTAAPTFLLDLLLVPGFARSRLRIITLAGAPVPRTLPQRGREALGCYICPAWGMTEIGIGISGSPRLPQDRVDATDGVPVAATEARVVSESGQEVPAGQEGNLQVRGAGLFLGYYSRPDFTQQAFAEGWFDTGDRAIAREDGFISITGRTKDIVIRGGMNIPVTEIESLLFQHPSVLEVAVVGYPDDRLGERACAVVVLKPGGQLDMARMGKFLLAQGLSRHYLPERLEIVDRLPKTMSGKIRKVELRQWLAQGGPAPG